MMLLFALIKSWNSSLSAGSGNFKMKYKLSVEVKQRRNKIIFRLQSGCQKSVSHVAQGKCFHILIEVWASFNVCFIVV